MRHRKNTLCNLPRGLNRAFAIKGDKNTKPYGPVSGSDGHEMERFNKALPEAAESRPGFWSWQK